MPKVGRLRTSLETRLAAVGRGKNWRYHVRKASPWTRLSFFNGSLLPDLFLDLRKVLPRLLARFDGTHALQDGRMLLWRDFQVLPQSRMENHRQCTFIDRSIRSGCNS